jgi:hypothetical protein
MFPSHRLHDALDIDLVHGVIEPRTFVNDVLDRGAGGGNVLMGKMKDMRMRFKSRRFALSPSLPPSLSPFFHKPW